LLAALLEHPLGAALEVPEELRYEELRAEAKPCLTIRSPQRNSWNSDRLRAQLSFDYGGWRVPDTGPSRGIYDPAARTLLVRDTTAEAAARQLLSQLGFSAPDKEYGETEPAWGLAPKKLPAVVRAWVGAGWHIEAEGKVFRSPGSMRVEVASGIDWFELHGEVEYGDTTANLPELLAALRRGENMVRLGDGTYGLLPEEWLGASVRWLVWGRPKTGTCASSATRQDFWTRCWPRNRRPGATKLSRAFATSCAASTASGRPPNPRVLTANSGTTSAKVSAGWSFCGPSVSAAAWPTTWAWAKRPRCWPCWRSASYSGEKHVMVTDLEFPPL
jgi:hypothetical protein